MAAKKVCSKCGKKRLATQYKSPRGRVCIPCQRARTRRSTKARRVQETYGITIEEWEALYFVQNGVCAICLGKRPMLDTDHNHKTGEVRGLLCRLCNRRLLVAARDNPDILRRAILYLEDPPARKVLS